jgi:ribosome-associated translation inhibitor RaiA
MKLMIKHRRVRSTHELDAVIEEQLIGLGTRLQVEQAVVALAHHPDKSPPFAADIHIATPGPDLRVEAVDHTLPAAFDKAIGQIRRRLDARDQRRTSRLRSRRQKTALYRSGGGRGWS